MATTPGKNKAAAALGKLGGKARARSLTPEQRKEIARKGGEARAKSLTPEQRRKIARKGVRGRKKKLATSGS